MIYNYYKLCVLQKLFSLPQLYSHDVLSLKCDDILLDKTSIIVQDSNEQKIIKINNEMIWSFVEKLVEKQENSIFKYLFLFES